MTYSFKRQQTCFALLFHEHNYYLEDSYHVNLQFVSINNKAMLVYVANRTVNR